jgi:hypothetical protein
MAGRHIDNQPFALPFSHSFKRLSHPSVVFPRNEHGPDPVYKRNELLLGKLTFFKLL